MTFKEYFKKLIVFGVPAGLGLIFAAYGLACWNIGTGVLSISQEALESHPFEPVEALIRYADTEENGLPKRNRAIWALGQLGDPRSLAMLEKHDTGDPCDHSQYLCQHELKKAITACREGWNIVRWTWIRIIPQSRSSKN